MVPSNKWFSSSPFQGENSGFESPWNHFVITNGVSGTSSADLRMVGTVKVKCVRVWSEGWSPYKINIAEE